MSAPKAPEILLVRHGETEWSLSGQHTGSTDIPLTERGRAQARLLRTRLKGRSFSLVLTSPLIRAAETCRLAGLGDEAQERGQLVEWNYGSYEGRTTADIRTEVPEWTVWTHASPGGEAASDVGGRVDTVIAELRAVDSDAIVFAHGHVLRVLAARWLGLPAETGRSFGLKTCTVSILGNERETPVIWLWNDDWHLAVPARGESFSEFAIP